MNENKIIPLTDAENDPSNEMSSQEFQRKLYAWFEDRGLLSELRAHLRTQMINVLKEKGVGRLVSSSKISPKLQAINLLIAEFLLQQDYHYTLSVFSAEVPLTNVLPEFPNYSINAQRHLRKWQFPDKDMWDILDTLGIQRYTEEAQGIFDVYYNTDSQDSLLTCIIKMLYSLQSQLFKKIDSQHLWNNFGNWRKDAHEVLTNHNISTRNANIILKLLSDILEAEHTQIRNEVRQEYSKVDQELRSHFQAALKEHEEKIAELQKRLNYEMSKNENLTKHYEKLQLQHRDRLQKLIAREQNVSKRETEITERDTYIKSQEMLMKTKMDALQQEQMSLSLQQERLECDLQQSNMGKIDTKLLHELNEYYKVKTTMTEIKGSDKIELENVQAEDMQNVITQLRSENDSLKSINADQQSHIRKLSRRATLLVHELEDSQHAYNNLQAHGNGIITVPPLTSPTSTMVGGGGGEQGIRHSQSIRQNYSVFSGASEAGRKRSASHRLPGYCSSSSEDPSPTSELLREARERLQRLEKESEEIDRNYKLYQSSISSNFKQFNSCWKVSSLMVQPSNFGTIFNGASVFNEIKDNKEIDEENLERRDRKQSEASSDIWEGAGTSGISLSAFPTSDEKTDSQEEKNDL